MNIATSFATYLQSLSIATLGQDLFIGTAPSSNEAPDTIWWIVANGGGPLRKNQTGETTKSYTVQVYCRNRNYRELADQMSLLEENLNCDKCTQLDGFETVDIEATVFPTDIDLDDEDRKVGLLQATITTYKEC